MRVILDANVIIAAFATRGLCESVFELCIENHEIVSSEEIITDIREKLIEKIGLPTSLVDSIEDFLRNHVLIAEPNPLPPHICRDPDDVRVLGLIPACKAEMVVTGDNDLLVLMKFDNCPIVSPRQFWEFNRQK